MAHLTNSAVDGLLGMLSKAVKDETKLLGGVAGDIQFIKDEMDSMNGFLLHLTKSKTPHDDQLRAWMKQVRDVTYVADDCIKLYMRDRLPPEDGVWPWLRHVATFVWTIPDRHRLGKKIHNLKDRVREVGERRQRYGVTLPTKQGEEEQMVEVARDSKVEEKKEEFLRALELVHNNAPCTVESFGEAIKMLPLDLGTDAGQHIDGILKKFLQGDRVDVASIKLLLRALYAYPYGTKEEVEDLSKKLQMNKGADVAKVVMTFCYSKLSTYCKSCLQHLVTLEEEDRISRTCLVRRWVAEGLVPSVVQAPHATVEEAGEFFFDELVFRGFLHPADLEDDEAGTCSLKFKSCIVDVEVKKFIPDISKSDNFVLDMPTHLRHQLEIRKLAKKSFHFESQPQQPPLQELCSGIYSCCSCGGGGGGGGATLQQAADHKPPPHPMDEMVKLLKGLPEEYRLNVLDLGGSQGLTTSHLKIICKVTSLKYLSLRKTNVSRLPKKMNKLWQLETLDIRQTNVRATDMRHIFLLSLKNLLAGGKGKNNEADYSTVMIPRWIGKKVEKLRHVQIKDDGQADLARIGSLEHLRKLGVVLDGRQHNITHLLRAINKRRDTLRSLSVWFTEPPPDHMSGDDVFVTLDHPGSGEEARATTELESLYLKCFFKGGNGSTCRGKLPTWIEDHQFLSKITLRHSKLTKDGLRMLGKLKSLRCLRLLSESYIEPEVTMEEGEFKELRLLQLDLVSNSTTQLCFKTGTAPKLEKITWNFDITRKTKPDITPGMNRDAFPEAFDLSGCRIITVGDQKKNN